LHATWWLSQSDFRIAITADDWHHFSASLFLNRDLADVAETAGSGSASTLALATSWETSRDLMINGLGTPELPEAVPFSILAR
jgi:hypothetical protein